MSSWLRLLVIALGASFALLACKLLNSNNGQSQASGLEGYVTSGDSTLWPSRSIPVCWDNASGLDQTAMGAVQDSVTSTYASAPLNFVFSGWSACGTADNGVHIAVRDAIPQVAAYGAWLDGMMSGVTLNFTFATSGFPACSQADHAAACIRSYAIHEFGHVLGLRHEANRPDSACSAQDQTGGLGESGAFPVGPYDPNSIMNYCKLNQDLQAGTVSQLSAEDIKTIDLYYSRQLNFPTPDLGAACKGDGGDWDSVRNCCQPSTQSWPSSEASVLYRACNKPSLDLQGQACAYASGTWIAQGRCCNLTTPSVILPRASTFFTKCLSP